MERCPNCIGWGEVNTKERKCELCHGTGIKEEKMHKCKIHKHYHGLKQPNSKARGCTCRAIYEHNHRFRGGKCSWCKKTFDGSEEVLTRNTITERQVWCGWKCQDLWRLWRAGKIASAPLKRGVS